MLKLMAWRWYGVKTVYRTTAQGELTETGKYFAPEATLVEERVVLIRARSFDAAVCANRMGTERVRDRWRRTKFIQHEFAGGIGRPVGGS